MSIKKTALCSIFLFFIYSCVAAQEKSTDDTAFTPLKLSLSEDGSKYLRFLMWHQVWVSSNNLAESNANLQVSTSLRRSRILAYTQVSHKFLLLTHFGLNSLNTDNLSATGSSKIVPRFFLHGAWAELKLSNSVYLGAGLHYWNGITRFASNSSISLLTLDQSRPFNAWHSLGITDQFARHLGIYIKGSAGKMEYRFAWNTPGHSPLENGTDYSSLFNTEGIPLSAFTYTGNAVPNASGQSIGNAVYTGYVKYNFWDNESTKLPYQTGTYLGKKKVLAIGAGFFLHPNGMYNSENNAHSNVRHFAIDAFMDAPVDNGVINSYFAVHNFNYGENYISRWGGTGMAYYGQLGYYFAPHKFMPYIAYSASNYEGANDMIEAIDVGVNYFISGHNCKITAEYHSIIKDFREVSMTFGGQDRFSQIRLQLQVFI